jgi:cell wall-associated NlpC family hydrolase
VPFRHQGRSRAGLDCLGLWAVTLKDCGLPVDDVTDYRREPDLRRLVRESDRQLIRLDPREPMRTGMFVLFVDDEWNHVGIVGPDNWMVHARGPEWAGRGVIHHRIDEQEWGPRIKRRWWHPGVRWRV